MWDLWVKMRSKSALEKETTFWGRLLKGCWCPRGRGGSPGFSWWGCTARFSKSWPYFWPKSVIFHTRFQTWPPKSIPFFRSGDGHKTLHCITCLHKTDNMSSLHQKDFLKSISNSHITLSFLFIWSWNDQHIDTRYQSWFPCKPYPIPDQNGAKTLPLPPTLGLAHTYMAYIRECPPPTG